MPLHLLLPTVIVNKHRESLHWIIGALSAWSSAAWLASPISASSLLNLLNIRITYYCRGLFKKRSALKMASAPQAFHKKEDFTTQIHLAQSHLDSYFKACDELHSDANLYSNNTWASTPPAEINELEDLKLTKTEVEQHAVRLVQTEPLGS